MKKYNHLSKALLLSTAIIGFGFSGCDSDSNDLNTTVQDANDLNTTVQDANDLNTTVQDAVEVVTDYTNGNSGTAVQEQNQTHIIVDENGTTTIDGSGLISDINLSELSAEDEHSLLFIREEEKLARDVYLYLDTKWGDQVANFRNIAKAEQSHTDSVKALLDRYSLEDPVTEDEDQNLGVFQDQTLQTYYDNLTTQGETSLIDALIVGATVEDLDIHDIELDIANTDNEDILIVYENLVKGSENHMRAFIGALEKQDYDSYEPQFISIERYEGILADSSEHNHTEENMTSTSETDFTEALSTEDNKLTPETNSSTNGNKPEDAGSNGNGNK
jgi:hypothetical protein